MTPGRDEKRQQKKLAKKAAKRKTKLVGRRLEPIARGSEPTLVISYEISEAPMPDLACERLPEQISDQLPIPAPSSPSRMGSAPR